MSYNTQVQSVNNPNVWIKWIEDAISNDHIVYYDYKHFNNVQIIGSGAFGKIYRAKWKHSDRYFALKSLLNIDGTTIKELVHEVDCKI